MAISNHIYIRDGKTARMLDIHSEKGMNPEIAYFKSSDGNIYAYTFEELLNALDGSIARRKASGESRKYLLVATPTDGQGATDEFTIITPTYMDSVHLENFAFKNRRGHIKTLEVYCKGMVD